MASRCIGQEVFKTIVEMAYEMDSADQIEKYAVPKAHLALMVANRPSQKNRHTILVNPYDLCFRMTSRGWGEEENGYKNCYKLSVWPVQNPLLTKEVHSIVKFNPKSKDKADIYHRLCEESLKLMKLLTYKQQKEFALEYKNELKRMWDYSDEQGEIKYVLEKCYPNLFRLKGN